MTAEASAMAAENGSVSPDDEEAAENAREQGEGINQVGSDAQTMDGAITQTRSRADSLAADAARAAEVNTQTRSKVGESQSHSNRPMRG